MAEYKYTASDPKGKTRTGQMTCPSPEAVKAALQLEGFYLLDLREIPGKKGKKLKANEVADFCRELGSMLSAGVSLVRAMNIIIGRDLPPKLKNCFIEINKQIKRGTSLSDAMVMQGDVFPELLINMVRSGEASGRMDDTLYKMADHFEKDHKLNGEIKSAMTYPLMLLVMTVLVVIGIFTFIFPRFMDMFSGMELPLLTQIMIGISEAFTEHWLMIILVCIIVGIAINTLLRNERVKFLIDVVKLKLPKVGKLLKIIYTARFARTLAVLYASGLSIVNALQIARHTVGNRYIDAQFDNVIKDVKAGQPLSYALGQVIGFDNKLSQTIVVGEETGKLDDLLVRVGESFDYESSMAIKKLLKLIEPIMICIMAAVIVTVMLSVMLPMFSLYGELEA